MPAGRPSPPARRCEAPMIRLIPAVLAAILEFPGWVQPAGPPPPLKAPAPIDAIAGIADALRSSPVIGLSPGDGHGDERGPAFVIALIRSEERRVGKECRSR